MVKLNKISSSVFQKRNMGILNIAGNSPLRHIRSEPLDKSSCGDPPTSILHEYSPVPGSSGDFQDVRNRFKPVLRSSPSFI